MHPRNIMSGRVPDFAGFKQRPLALLILFAQVVVASEPRPQYSRENSESELADEERLWSPANYPDLRGENHEECGRHITATASFICDPDRLLSKTEAGVLNQQLLRLATSTPCHCQRKSQCVTDDVLSNEIEIGFVVAIALVRDLATGSREPMQSDVDDVAEKFTRSVHGSWALGDCGNAALILYWDSVNKVYITTARLTKLYLTDIEAKEILRKAEGDISKKLYFESLSFILDEIEIELKGEAETKVDTGTLFLIISIAVALGLVCIITGCVCAFRCCGNLRPQPDTTMGRALGRVDTIKNEVIRRSSRITQSFALSRSPKQPPSKNSLQPQAGGDCTNPVLASQHGSAFSENYCANHQEHSMV